MKCRFVLIASLLVLSLATVCAVADTSIVVPGALTASEGAHANGFPFNIAYFSLNSMHYQQVYGAAAFAGLSGPISINTILFRPDGSVYGSSFSSTLPNVEIRLSTTAKLVDALDVTFANNVGADVALVHSGALALSSSNTGPVSGPKDFDIAINLSTPFIYDASKGNLLMDVMNFRGGSTTFFDLGFVQDETSRLYYEGDSSSVYGYQDTGGLVTRFDYTTAAVPEPATLLGFGIPMLMVGLGKLRGLRK